MEGELKTVITKSFGYGHFEDENVIFQTRNEELSQQHAEILAETIVYANKKFYNEINMTRIMDALIGSPEVITSAVKSTVDALYADGIYNFGRFVMAVIILEKLDSCGEFNDRVFNDWYKAMKDCGAITWFECNGSWEGFEKHFKRSSFSFIGIYNHFVQTIRNLFLN